MKSYLIIGLILTLIGCNEQSDKRKTRVNTGTIPNLFSTQTTSSNPGSATDVSDATSDPYGSDTDGYLTIPEGAVTCNWSRDGQNDFIYRSMHLSVGENDPNNGFYNICRSSSDQNVIHFQMKNTTSDHQICFIPTTHNGNLKTYIGEPRCESVTNVNKIYSLRMHINRPNYVSSRMTGVMIMRDKAYHYSPPFNQLLLSPDAFIFCNQWLAAYGDSSYCQSFANAGHYEYHQFPQQ